MTEFLALGDAARAWASSALALADERCYVPESGVTLLAPVPRPGKIICLGYNYYDHTEGASASLPEYPTFLPSTRMSSSVPINRSSIRAQTSKWITKPNWPS